MELKGIVEQFVSLGKNRDFFGKNHPIIRKCSIKSAFITKLGHQKGPHLNEENLMMEERPFEGQIPQF